MRLLFICTSFLLAAQSASAQGYFSRIPVQPETRVIVQRGDTAWFIPVAQSPHYPLTHAVGYLKSSRRWIGALTEQADLHNIERTMPHGLVLEQVDSALADYWGIDV